MIPKASREDNRQSLLEGKGQVAMKQLIARFVKEEAGQDLIEYALLAAFVSLAVIGAMQFLAGSISQEYSNVAGSVTGS